MKLKFFAALICLCWNGIFAQNAKKINITSEVLLKIFSENSAWDLPAQDSFRVVIVYDSSNVISKHEAGLFGRVFGESSRLPGDKPIAVQLISESGFDKIAWQGRNVAFFPHGEFTFLGSILKYCEEAQVLTASSDTTMIAKGVAVAVDVGEKNYPEIWFNVNALKNEGAEFRKEILQLAKHVEW